MYNLIAELNSDNQDIVEFCNHEIELLDNKKSKGNAKANEKVSQAVEIVYNALVEVDRPITVSDLIASADLSPLANDEGVITTQKVSSMLKKLREQGRVESYVDKKKTYFKVIG